MTIVQLNMADYGGSALHDIETPVLQLPILHQAIRASPSDKHTNVGL